MDLSAIIFAVVALGWAAYLLPMAVRHHDHRSTHRTAESLSHNHRLVGRAGPTVAVPPSGAAPTTPTRAAGPQPAVTASARAGMRASTRRAMVRRRIVMGILLAGLLTLVGTSQFGVTPWWSTAIPGAMLAAFIVVARVTVRRERAHRRSLQAPPAPTDALPVIVRPDRATEDTEALSRDDIADAVASPAPTQDGGLWDPVPITVPTYVDKPRVQRTVRTIELTGMTSSGHDEADSALVRQAERVEQPAAERKVSGA